MNSVPEGVVGDDWEERDGATCGAERKGTKVRLGRFHGGRKDVLVCRLYEGSYTNDLLSSARLIGAVGSWETLLGQMKMEKSSKCHQIGVTYG